MSDAINGEDSEHSRPGSPDDRRGHRKPVSIREITDRLVREGNWSIDAAKKKAQELAQIPPGNERDVEICTVFNRINAEKRHQEEMRGLPLDERRDLFYEQLRNSPQLRSGLRSSITPERTRLEISPDGILTVKVSGEYVLSSCQEPATLEIIASAAAYIGCKSDVTVSIDEELAAIVNEQARHDTAAGSSPHRPAKKEVTQEDLASRCQYFFKNLKTNCEHLNKERDRWDELIFGPCNNLARATVEEALAYFRTGRLKDHVAFINGDSATGKTALLQGISWIIQKGVKEAITQLQKFDREKLNKPEHSAELNELTRAAEFRLRYATAEDIMNEFQLVGRKVLTMIDFEAKYAGLNVLIIDDIQYLNQQDKAVGTKRELYKIVNRMMETNKFLICASDIPFSKLKDIDRRVQTRIGNGIRASMDYPDADVKMQAFVKCLEKRKKYITNGYRADFEVIIDRAPDFRAVESIAATYCQRLDKLGENPMDALLYLKKQYPCATPKDLIWRISEIINASSTMANLAGHPEQLRESRDEYATAIREAAIYVTYLLASKEQGAMTATFLRNQWGFKKNAPIARIIEKFEKMQQDGLVVPEGQIYSAGTSAAMFTTFYGVYREYLGRKEEARRLPLFGNIENPPAQPSAPPSEARQGEPSVPAEPAQGYQDASSETNPPGQPEE